MSDDDLIITADDVRKAGYCIRPGLRDWCAAHDVDFRTFVQKGYPASYLLEKGDGLAVRVIDSVRSRHGR